MEALNTLDPVVNLHEELEPNNDSDNYNHSDNDELHHANPVKIHFD